MNIKEANTQLIQFSYYITVFEKTQKEAARLVGISEKTAVKLVREHNLKPKLNKLKSAVKSNPIKYDDSLSAFRAYVRINHPELNGELETVYTNFSNKI